MSVEIYIGDSLEVLRELPDSTYHCCVTSPPYYGLRSYLDNSDANKLHELGMEQTPQDYVASIVGVFSEVRRVLRPDGVCFLNIGDSYSLSGKGGNPENSRHQKQKTNYGSFVKATKPPNGFKPKELLLIPERLAIALQEDGWYIRSRIAWVKNNPMPESVRDRPTSAWEHIWMLTRNPRYFWDALAVAEPSVSDHGSGNGFKRSARLTYQDKNGARGNDTPWESGGGTRNLRNVWQINARPFSGAHFATFPPDIPELCIKAATSEFGCCAHCGAPWKRLVKKGEPLREQQLACGSDAEGQYTGEAQKDYAASRAQNASDVKRRILEGMREKITVGWQATCECEASRVPCRVLDPFAGSGTTGMVAKRLNRDATLIDLNGDYLPIIQQRLTSGK